jgi:putative ABC transport system permease protein
MNAGSLFSLNFRSTVDLSLSGPIFAIITFALGIGINTLIFSIANSVLFNPISYPNPDQLVAIDETKPGFADGSISYPNFLDWQAANIS